MIFLDIFKHLLPNAKAWIITIDKNLRRFFEGLSGLGSDIKEYFDLIWLDIFPASTREIEEGEFQFGLTNNALTAEERRARLDAAWKASGGQDPRYIQDTLQNNGFNVFVHEWWEPGTEPAVGVKQCVDPRDPRMHLRGSTVIFWSVTCGEPLAQCGEPLAQCGERLGQVGYALVNKFLVKGRITISCGRKEALCKKEVMLCGNTVPAFIPRVYEIPDDPAKWTYFFYIGGETFPELASVDPKRKNEFEALCLKLCPTQLWIGILVQYT